MNFLYYLAATSTDPTSDACNKLNPTQVGCDADVTSLAGHYIQIVLDVLFIAAGIAAVIAIIWGGFIMTSSAGDPGKVAKGKKAVIGGIIGLIISLLAVSIVNFVLSIV